MGESDGLWASVKQCASQVTSTVADRGVKIADSAKDGVSTIGRLHALSTSQIPGVWEAVKSGAGEKIETFTSHPVASSYGFAKTVVVDQWTKVNDAATAIETGPEPCGALTGVLLDSATSKVMAVAGAVAVPALGALVKGEKVVRDAKKAERVLGARTATGAPLRTVPPCAHCGPETPPLRPSHVPTNNEDYVKAARNAANLADQQGFPRARQAAAEMRARATAADRAGRLPTRAEVDAVLAERSGGG